MICIISPSSYVHSAAFLELGELILFSLKDLGFDASMSQNTIDPSAKNIIIGSHLIKANDITRLPKSTIVLNTEQIYTDSSSWNSNIFAWAKSFEVWDYSERNILKFNQIGINNVKLFKIGFQKDLIRIGQRDVKDVDVLFYGSINERRKKIISELEKAGLKVKTLFGVYGRERDNWIARSKMVLNMHFMTHKYLKLLESSIC